MKRDNLWQRILRTVWHYLVFFMLVAVVVTTTMYLFITILSKDLNLALTGDNLNRAAKLTFLSVVLISVLITVIDVIRRKLTTERITKRIAKATKELVKGKFDTHIALIPTLMTDDNYNEIIDCFNKMSQELGSLETLRTDFIADVSHEMKTPLAVIQNYAQLLSSPIISDTERKQYCKEISLASRRMSDMITNILKLNRLENQQIYPNTANFNLSEQLCECLLQFEDIWEQKGIEPIIEITEDVTVLADAELLSLVWNNIFSNAFKFTDNGGKVFITLTATENTVTVKVTDTGCGMSKEVGNYIFEKFYQGDTSHATAGNGLGLSLVKRVVDILLGEISVESTQGVGTSFTVTVPRKPI